MINSDDIKAERKKARQESEAWQTELKQALSDELILPPWYLPSAWACVCLFVTLSLHALFFLLCHWLVSFKAWALYQVLHSITLNSVVCCDVILF